MPILTTNGEKHRAIGTLSVKSALTVQAAGFNHYLLTQFPVLTL